MARAPGTRDFRDLKPSDGKKPKDDRPADQSSTRRDWWKLEGADCANAVKAVVLVIQGAQTSRITQQVIASRLYGNMTMVGASAAAYRRIQTEQTSSSRGRLTYSYNAVQEIVDTLVSRVGETKPRPYFITSGGNYKQQRKAKKLNQYVEGVFYEEKTYDKGLDSFRDGGVWGDGFMHVYGDEKQGRIRHERVWSSELWVDEVEAQYGYPRSMYRVKVVDKQELAGAFPDFEKEILAASVAPETQTSGQSMSTSDMVTVCESWHLGTRGDDGKCVGGKHAITLVSNSTMLVEPEEWPFDFFPFARVPWCTRPIGYYSQGLCEQLQCDQIELNKELALIQRSMHLAGSFKILLPIGSKVAKESINNDVGTVISYTGQKAPEYITPAPIHPVYFQNTALIIERMRDRAGVSKMQTTGTKPAGELSGKALREIEEVASDRHRTTQRHNDNFYIEIARLTVILSNDMSKRGKLKSVRVPGRGVFQSIDWRKDIESVETDEFVLQIFPVSRLPKDPAGRLATIQEYIQAGFITPRQGKRALDFPDLETIESLANAQEDLLTKVLDDVVDDAKYTPPEPTDDLALGKQLVLEYIQRYRQLGLEDEKLDMLRTWNSQVDALQKMAQQQMMAQQAAMQPQAAPMPQPRSQLVPNVPQVAA